MHSLLIKVELLLEGIWWSNEFLKEFSPYTFWNQYFYAFVYSMEKNRYFHKVGISSHWRGLNISWPKLLSSKLLSLPFASHSPHLPKHISSTLLTSQGYFGPQPLHGEGTQTAHVASAILQAVSVFHRVFFFENCWSIQAHKNYVFLHYLHCVRLIRRFIIIFPGSLVLSGHGIANAHIAVHCICIDQMITSTTTKVMLSDPC